MTAFEIIGAARARPWVITVDHASNHVPPCTHGGDLGICAQDMARHIAYDVGARGLALALGEYLDAPVVASTFSRLVIDPNRGEDDPTLIMRLYDGTIIPANRCLEPAEITRRIESFYRPYHAAMEGLLAARPDPVILAIHSFTPQLRGRPPRPWHIGVLSGADRRLADPLLARLAREADLCVGDNEPYNGALAGDALDQHGINKGRPHVLIELRNDLIETPADQAHWAKRLAPILDATLRDLHDDHTTIAKG